MSFFDLTLKFCSLSLKNQYVNDADDYFIKSFIRLATYVDLMALTNSCVEVVGIQEVSQQSFGSAEKETISTLGKK